MNIHFDVYRGDEDVVISKQGDRLTINGEEFDFSAIPEGALLPASAVKSEFISSARPIERLNGEIHLTLRIPHKENASKERRFLEPIVDAPNGFLELPQ